MNESEIIKNLRYANNKIERHFDEINENNKSLISQNIIVGSLRNFLEAVFLLIYSKDRKSTDTLEVNYNNIQQSKNYINSVGKYRELKIFYDRIQNYSHMTIDIAYSERLMDNYIEYLIIIKKILFEKYNLVVLSNIEKYSLTIDDDLKEYYFEISKLLKSFSSIQHKNQNQIYYIERIKAIYINKILFYEITFVPIAQINNRNNKIIAFSIEKPTKNYSCNIDYEIEKIIIKNKIFNVKIVTNWSIYINNRELIRLAHVLGLKVDKKTTNSDEKKFFFLYLSREKVSINHIIDFNNFEFERFIKKLKEINKNSIIVDILVNSRKLIIDKNSGYKTISYFLFKLRDHIIKKQLSWNGDKNLNISNLRLNNGVLLFENLPFVCALNNHIPSLSDLIDCFGNKGYEEEILARIINNNINNNLLFTDINDLNINCDDAKKLIKKFNSKLDTYSKDNKLVIYYDRYISNGHKIKEFWNILSFIKSKAISNDKFYEQAKKWKLENNYKIDDPKKEEIFLNGFKKSEILFIHGSAGTGKSTLINHFVNFFENKRILFLTSTYTALENLKSKIIIKSNSFNFLTIQKYVSGSKSNYDVYDLIIIDECSTISNENIYKVFKKTFFTNAIFVGDSLQIESIKFGIWFNIIVNIKESFLNVFNLETIYRAKSNEKLLKFWKKVRNLDNDIIEFSIKKEIDRNSNIELFDNENNRKNEIILCLNYDGLYGVNNLNNFLQGNNKNLEYKVGDYIFKENDPILFNDHHLLKNIIYNNEKGIIKKIKKEQNKDVFFEIELENNNFTNEIDYGNFKIFCNENNKKIVHLIIKENEISESIEEDKSVFLIPPFTLAYAISIHKSQGLEFDNVSIVITNDIGEQITHNVFYTAITRAKNNLKIYWSKNTQKSIIKNFSIKNHKLTMNLLKNINEKKENLDD